MKNLSVEEKRACLMMGILMLVSRCENLAKLNVINLDEEGAAIAASKDYRTLIESIWNIFPNGMEEEVLQFAKDLGMSIEQYDLSQSTQLTQ